MFSTRSVVVLTIACSIGATALPTRAVFADEAGRADRSTAPNLVQNGDFEEVRDGYPVDWRQLDEDVTYPWRRRSYMLPEADVYSPSVCERGNSHTGLRSVLCAAAPGQVSGLTQRIVLNQNMARPITIGAWCRSENVDAESWCDLIPQNVRYMDGTYHQMPFDKPFVALGENAHGWSYRTGTFTPEKPIRYVDLKISVRAEIGNVDDHVGVCSHRTGLLWVDDVHLSEVGSSAAELAARGVTVPVPTVTAFPAGRPAPSAPSLADSGQFDLYYGEESFVLEFEFPDETDGDIELLLATHDQLSFENERVESFYRATLPWEGAPRFERAFERAERGLAIRDVTHYLETPLAEPIVCTRVTGEPRRLRAEIPYSALRAERPRPGTVWRVNVVQRPGTDLANQSSTADEANHRRFARLEFALPPRVEISATGFGNRVPPDARENPWVARTETFWGDNTLGLNLCNTTANDIEAIVRISGLDISAPDTRVSLPTHETIHVNLPYRVERDGLVSLMIEVADKDGQILARERYPVCIPPAIDLWPGWRYFYPDEKVATITGQIHARGPEDQGPLMVRVLDRVSGDEVYRGEASVAQHAFSHEVDISNLRISHDPVAEYQFVVSGPPGTEARFPFGRLERPVFEKLPPIKTVDIDDDGMLLVNGKRFFPIVSSLNVNDLEAGHAESSAMGCNVSKHNFSPPFDDTQAVFDTTWSHNTYEAPCPVRA